MKYDKTQVERAAAYIANQIVAINPSVKHAWIEKKLNTTLSEYIKQFGPVLKEAVFAKKPDFADFFMILSAKGIQFPDHWQFVLKADGACVDRSAENVIKIDSPSKSRHHAAKNARLQLAADTKEARHEILDQLTQKLAAVALQADEKKETVEVDDLVPYPTIADYYEQTRLRLNPEIASSSSSLKEAQALDEQTVSDSSKLRL